MRAPRSPINSHVGNSIVFNVFHFNCNVCVAVRETKQSVYARVPQGNGRQLQGELFARNPVSILP